MSGAIMNKIWGAFGVDTEEDEAEEYENEEEVIEDFIRIHVSFLVNRNHFKTVTRDKIQLVDGTYVPISRKYMKQFKGMYE